MESLLLGRLTGTRDRPPPKMAITRLTSPNTTVTQIHIPRCRPGNAMTVIKQEGLVCFSCRGNFEDCGRKQLLNGDPVRVCATGHSCIVGRTGTGEPGDEFSMYSSKHKLGLEGNGQDSSYVYFRDCFHETCGLELDELHCVQEETNVTCQRCCARNRCNADAFSSGVGLSSVMTCRLPGFCLGLLTLTWLALA